MATTFSRNSPDEGHDVLEATEARQGRWGRHMFWVLLVSTILAAVVLFSSWAFRSGDLSAANEASTPTAAEAAATTGPESPVRQ